MRSARIALGLALLVAACSGDPATPSVPSATLPMTDALTVETAMPGGEPIQVIAVLDGDSLKVVVGGAVEEIRLLGINTPERQECWSAEARTATAALLEAGATTLVSDGRDQYGRLLGYVGAGEVFVNAQLVAEGHAMALANDHTFIDEFLSMEQAAFDARAGMWASDACGHSLGTGMHIDRVDGDPSGRDDDPATGESIRIRNNGEGVVHLQGWTIRDESSVHRYRFPADTMLDAGETVTVYSVCGRHEHCFGPSTVWSNDGDTALLMDPSGNIVDRVRFAG